MALPTDPEDTSTRRRQPLSRTPDLRRLTGKYPPRTVQMRYYVADLDSRPNYYPFFLLGLTRLSAAPV